MRAVSVFVVATSVTWSAADRVLSSSPPSFTNDATCRLCAPGVSGGSAAVHGKPVAAAVGVHATSVASVRVPST